MEINYDLDLGGYHVELKETFEKPIPEPMKHIKQRIEEAKAEGIGAYKRPAFGGRGGNGNHAPEAWAKATEVRVFTYSKDGENKKALDFGLEPEAGQFAVRNAVAWDVDPILAAMPAPLKAAVEEAWKKDAKGGVKLALSSIALEVGFYRDGDKLKAVAVRIANGNGNGTAAAAAKVEV